MAEEHSIKNLYHTLTNTDVPASDEPYTLEEILAEYGGSLEQQLLRQAEQEAAALLEAETGQAADAEQASA